MVEYRAAVRLVPTTPRTAARARVLAAYADALERGGTPDEARPWADEAVAIAREVDSPFDEGHARHALGVALEAAGDTDGALAELHLARELAERNGDVADVAGTYLHLWRILSEHGRGDEMVALAVTAADLCRAAELEVAALLLDCLAAGFLHQLGRWDEAEARLPVDDADVWGLPAVVVRVVSGLLAVDRGRLDEAEEHLETARALGAQIHDGRINGLLARGRTELALWRGRPEDAAAAVADGLRLTSDDEMRARLCWLGLRAAADVAEQQRATTGTWDARPRGRRARPAPRPPGGAGTGPAGAAGLGGARRGRVGGGRAGAAGGSGRAGAVGRGRSALGRPRVPGPGGLLPLAPGRGRAVRRAPRPGAPPVAGGLAGRRGPRRGRAARRPSRRMRPGRRCPSPARARRRRTSRRSPSGSPPGSWRCWPWSRPAARTARSASACSSARRRPACTCRASWPSSAPVPGPRPRRWPARWAWSARPRPPRRPDPILRRSGRALRRPEVGIRPLPGADPLRPQWGRRTYASRSPRMAAAATAVLAPPAPLLPLVAAGDQPRHGPARAALRAPRAGHRPPSGPPHRVR